MIGRQRERGQATVEAALVLPLVVLLLLAVVQVGLLVRAEVLVTHAAREAARAAALATTLDARRMAVRVEGRNGPGSRVRVDITYTAPTDVPLVGALIGDVSLHVSATMRVE